MSNEGQQNPVWSQPPFQPEEPAPTVTGQVLAPGEHAPVVPPPSTEEAVLRVVRRLIWPVTILICLLTRDWWPMLLAALLVSSYVGYRVRELRRRRLQGIGRMR